MPVIDGLNRADGSTIIAEPFSPKSDESYVKKTTVQRSVTVVRRQRLHGVHNVTNSTVTAVLLMLATLLALFS